MALHIDNAQFNAFVAFAQNAKDVNAVAGDSAPAGPLASRTISVRKDDSMHAFIRSDDSKQSNDQVRDLFRNSVINLFGGESRVPENVKKAMALSDYGKGRPLTARRILVVQAAIDAVKGKINVQGDNAKIASSIGKLKFDQLPPDIDAAIEEVRAETEARGSAGMGKDKGSFIDFLGRQRVRQTLNDFAKASGRPLSRTDVRDILRGMVNNGQLVEVERLSAFMASLGTSKVDALASRAPAYAVMKAVPGLAEELAACRSGADFDAVFKKFGSVIEAHMVIMDAAEDCKARMEDVLVEEFVKATGKDEAFFRDNVPLPAFRTGKGETIRDKIATGAIKANSPREVEAAFRDAARAYVKEHLAAAAEADGVAGISDAVRESLKYGAIVAQSVKEYRIAEYAPLASKLDLGALKAAVLQKPFSAEAASAACKDMLDGLRTIGQERFGLDKWRLLGVDGQQPFAAILMKCALSGEPELTKVLAEHSEEIFAGVRDLIPLGSGDAGGMIMAVLAGAMPAVKQLAEQL